MDAFERGRAENSLCVVEKRSGLRFRRRAVWPFAFFLGGIRKVARLECLTTYDAVEQVVGAVMASERGFEYPK